MLRMAAQARKAIWEAVNPNTGKRRIEKLETDKQGDGRFIVVTAPADCPAESIDKAITDAGLPPAGERDFVVVLTRFATGDFEPTARLGG